jgi:hypothetical protein
MLYSVFASGAEWRVEYAIDEERDVQWIELNFTNEAKFAAVRFLQNNAKEGNNTYLYHFYKDNCATRLRDIINAATEDQFRVWAENQEERGTYRTFAQRSLAHAGVTAWFLNFLQGREIDKSLNLYDEMFLPESLNQAVLDFTYADGSPLAQKITILQDTAGQNIRFTPLEKDENNDWQYALAGLFLGLVSCVLFFTGHKKAWALYNGLLLLVLSIIGTLLLFMMTLSNMDMTWFNENIVYINPLLWIACVQSFSVVFSKKKKSAPILRTYRLFSILVVLLVIAKGLFPTVFVQDNLNIILVVLPLYLVGFVRDGSSRTLKR